VSEPTQVEVDRHDAGHFLTTVASPEGLGEFCSRRMAAWLWRDQHREGGRAPASLTDPVLARYHFTNVYRDLDPGSVLAVQLLRRYDRATGPQAFTQTELRHHALWTAVAYRLTNRRSTWVDYRASWFGTPRWPSMDTEEDWLTFLDIERAAGRRIFTGRHLTVGWDRYTRALQGVRHLEPAHVDALFANAGNFLMDVRSVHGVGQFFAWQVTADLLASGHLPAAPDVVALGPGAKLALRWLQERRPWAEMFNAAGRRVVAAGNGHLSERQAYAAIVDLRTNQAGWLPASFVPPDGRRLELVDLEHALCEYARWGALHHRLALKVGR
jgi:hypothetical protein